MRRMVSSIETAHRLSQMVKNEMRAVAEVLETKLDTVRKWVNRAAEYTEEVNAVLLKEMKVTKVELDELWTFVQKNNSENGAV